jgi:hypothetical protein
LTTPLRTFLNIKYDETDNQFPHLNKGANVDNFLAELVQESEYRKNFIAEFGNYLDQFGLKIEPITNA